MTPKVADRAVVTTSLTSGERGQYPCTTADRCCVETARKGYFYEEPMDLMSAVLERPKNCQATLFMTKRS